MIPRRTFLKTAAGGSALAALIPLGFLSRLPAVSAAEATVPPRTVQLNPDIEPLVRFLEETPRERLLEEVAARIHRGLSYREVLTALMLAGVRSIQPRPVGFKFHAVLVINSAHLASLASPDSDRWLPIFWAIDQFKSSQAANVKEGNWTMPPVDENAVPPSHRAREAFVTAMDRWDEAAADAAIAGLVRNAGADELFDLFARYGARDFRDIGHKMIYVSNSFRCLEVIGWQHAEPVLRSLTYALLERSGAKANPADADLPEDRPFRENLTAQKVLPESWTGGQRKEGATVELLELLRTGSAADASKLSIDLLNKGAAPSSLFDAFFCGAGELLMRAPGIVSLHAVTFTNAAHYAWQRCRSDETRRLLLLQNAAFLPLYRGAPKEHAVKIDALDPLAPTDAGAGVAEIFDDISRDRLVAARKILAHVHASPDAAALFAQSARRLVFAKGTNAHDYKFSSAVLEDYHQLASPWRERLLAASAFYLRGSGDRDNVLVQRTRAALAS
jgi:hypothetical protein